MYRTQKGLREWRGGEGERLTGTVAEVLQQTLCKGVREKNTNFKEEKTNIKTLALSWPTSDLLEYTGDTGGLSALFGIYLLQSSCVSDNTGA